MNILAKKKNCIFLILLLVFFGCATSKYISGRDFDMSKVEKIEKGVTTQNEIINWFGQPQSKSLIYNSEIWTYMYIHSQAKATSYIFTMDVKGQSYYKSLSITFDNNKIVQGVSYQATDTTRINVN
jgi:outer membrane protein assembly factor BamE (lipoprotein component of BamABCDE complex)